MAGIGRPRWHAFTMRVAGRCVMLTPYWLTRERSEMAMWQNSQELGAGFALGSMLSNSRWPGGAAWIETPFAAAVRGTSRGSERFRLDTVLDGLSPTHLALRLPCQLEEGRPLFVVIWLGLLWQGCTTGRGIAVRGPLVGETHRPGGVWRVLVKVNRLRFLYARAV